MSSISTNLGNVEYVYLSNIDCNNGETAQNSTSFKWNLPYMNPREGPYMFIQVCQAYVDYTDGNGGGASQHLRYTTIQGINTYSTGNYELASLMERDNITLHWRAMPDAPILQIPSSTREIIFIVGSNVTGLPLGVGNGGTMDIVLKIIRPINEKITQNTLASYAKTFA